MPFTAEQARLIDEAQEVTIETQGKNQAFRTVIWIVVEGGEVFVRSVRGDDGKWFRRASRDPSVALHVAGTRIPARAIPATDPESVKRTDDALIRKYRKGRSLDAMLKADIRDTTLRLDPA